MRRNSSEKQTRQKLEYLTTQIYIISSNCKRIPEQLDSDTDKMKSVIFRVCQLIS